MPAPVDKPGPARERVIAFEVGGELLGLPIGDVKETLERRPLTHLFLVPSCVAGLVNLRGEVLAVLDLAKLVGLPSDRPEGAASPRARGLPAPARDAEERDARILVLRGRGGSSRAAAGLLVDRVVDVRDLDPAALAPPPPTVPADAAALLRGVAPSHLAGDGRPLLVLDSARLLDAEPLRPLRRKPSVEGAPRRLP